MSDRYQAPQVIEAFLPYNERLEQRDTSELDLIVVHCTELPTLDMAREYGERILLPETKTGFSGHYYIDRDGKVYRYIGDGRVARHVIGFNPKSIGIEVVNLGRYPNWFHSSHQTCTEPYTPEQIDATKKLLRFLKQQYPQIRRIARHSDLDTTMISAEDDPTIQIRRKVDPGPLFPWEDILKWWEHLDKSFEAEERSYKSGK